MNIQTRSRLKQSRVPNWRLYYIAVHQRPPSYLAQLALRYITLHGTALDLGSGAFNDSKLFLETGFSEVISIDQSEHLKPYAHQVAQAYGSRFCFRQQRFQDVQLEPNSFDLIHSNFALPYHGTEGFESFIKKVMASLRPSGIFSGIFFGKGCDWKHIDGDVACLTEQELRELVTDLELQYFHEVQFEVSDTRSPSEWHYFRVVAKKPSFLRV